jgi:tRNA-2-methylthio-N6-dimethylallyladenosine synthase
MSRPAKEILTECRQLLEQGYKEITLVGQNVNSYRSGRYDFPKLLKEIDQLKGDYWLRFTTSHPKDLSGELIEIMSRGKHLAPYLHLPIQSGDKDILRAMNRHYTPGQYLKLVAKVRERIPGLTVSTDVIVGYPKETEKQFANTAKVMRQVKFDLAYINKYSPRSGTAAAKLGDDVSWPEKKRREKVLNEILKKTALGHNKKLINKTVRVLVDGWKNGNCFGKSAAFKTVVFAGTQKLVGKFVAVKIASAGSWGLKGQLI